MYYKYYIRNRQVLEEATAGQLLIKYITENFKIATFSRLSGIYLYPNLHTCFVLTGLISVAQKVHNQI